MLPREHGAYGQLLFPLATALAVGRPGAAALVLAASAVLAFLAHEPLLVLLGQRGVRAAREERTRAWRWFAPSASASTLLAAIAVALMRPPARIALIVPAVLAAIVAMLIVARRERTSAGEILTALTLSSLACPVALAADAAAPAALSVASAFAAAFVSATISVRAVIMHTRRPPARPSRIVAGIFAGASLGALAWAGLGGLATSAGLWAALPVCGASLVLVVVPPSASRLRVVGWTLVTATLATAAILIAALHGMR